MERAASRGKQIVMVLQDPGQSLNPVVRVERQLPEGPRRRLGLICTEARARALDLLKEVGVPDPGLAASATVSVYATRPENAFRWRRAPGDIASWEAVGVGRGVAAFQS
ncbi:hypothetical protein MXD63_30465, partial [Frankia sp. Cpl3]|nr:hypothetical protein [Frankia sp. Cpl3]